ncbi:MAG: hypothetical protein ABIR34_12525 [Marmoricola sp.]
MSVLTGTRRRPTPDAGGYVLAVLVSIGVTTLLLVLTDITLHDLQRDLAALLVATIYVTLFALPTAPIGVLLVHLACRRVEQQSVHVLAAGLAGVLTGLCFGAWVDGVSGLADTFSLSLILGVATAAGRAAVIPLRPRVRTPVDSDFVPERPAC